MMPLLRARWPRGRVEWALVFWIGLVLFAGDYGLIYWAEQWLESGLTAILFATLPLITIVFAHLYLPGDRITGRKLAGTLLAFVIVSAGILVLRRRSPDLNRPFRTPWVPVVPILAIVIVAGYGFIVWMYQIIAGPPSGRAWRRSARRRRRR